MSGPAEQIRILVVEDERDALESTRRLLQGCGYDTVGASSAEEAYRYFEAIHPHILVVDYKLPGMNGADFLRHAKTADPTVSAVMITGLMPQIASIEAQAQEIGVAVLRKPVQVEKLQKAIEEFVNRRSAP